MFFPLAGTLEKALNEAKRNIDERGYFQTENCVTDNGEPISVRIFDELERLGYVRRISDWYRYEIPESQEFTFAGIYALKSKADVYYENLAEYERLLDSSNSTIAINSFSGDASHIQIQQNTNSSSQTMDMEKHFDYNKAAEIFEQIIKNRDDLKLPHEKEDELLEIASEALQNARSESDSNFVKKSLQASRDFLIGVSGSLAASGILYMIAQMGV